MTVSAANTINIFFIFFHLRSFVSLRRMIIFKIAKVKHSMHILEIYLLNDAADQMHLSVKISI